MSTEMCATTLDLQPEYLYRGRILYGWMNQLQQEGQSISGVLPSESQDAKEGGRWCTFTKKGVYLMD